ncbi:hypothetical protein GCM10022232_38660 [Streptomyces plumbiresistens]|uniref:Uncharacterized protein n=1 Tax=Streptomyces plumbiresistens TaxID=511811 RepID=A0ABP7RHV1_9ACTN
MGGEEQWGASNGPAGRGGVPGVTVTWIRRVGGRQPRVVARWLTTMPSRPKESFAQVTMLAAEFTLQPTP